MVTCGRYTGTVHIKSSSASVPSRLPKEKPDAPRKGNRLEQVVKVLDTVTNPIFDFNHTISALPKFIYPTVSGSPEQKALIWEVLDQMPMHHAVRPTSITVVPTLPKGPNLLGQNQSVVGRIFLNESGNGMDQPLVFQSTTAHEVGHSVDHSTGIFGVLSKTRPSDAAPFGMGANVSDYAGTNPREDFAESYELHRNNADMLRGINSDKAAALEKVDKAHFLEQLVDRPAFRETGKWIGERFESCPQARTGLEYLRQMSIVMLGASAASFVGTGAATKNGSQVAMGMLQAGAAVGLAMAPQQPWLGLAATAALGANRGIQVAQELKADGARTTAASLGGALGGMVGGFAAPLGLTQLGYSVAGPVGGTVGLVVGGVLGSQLGAKWGARAALALTSD